MPLAEETVVDTNPVDDVDALYESITNPKSTDEPLETSAPPPEPEHEYDWKGTKIKAPLSEILRKASMGHDYSQKMGEWNKKERGYQEKISLSEKLRSEYEPIDKWVRENPDKWEKLSAVIKNEQKGYGDLDPNHPLLKEIAELKNQISPVISNFEKQRIATEDTALKDEIQSIQEKFKDLDWKTSDENGRTLEQRVIAHALENDIKTYKLAFYDLYQDELLKRAEDRGKESLASERQRQAKAGLLGKTQAPLSGMKKAQSLKTKSYDDLSREALEEMGLT